MLHRDIEISNSEDVIDVRDVIARFETLENLGDDKNLTQEDLDEKELLFSLLDDLKSYSGDEQWRGDWYPVTLIRDSYFVEAMQQLCEDIGDFPNGVPGYYVIDWEATARNLQADYSSVEFEGVTYWYR
jgi:antirestriction protein